MAGFKKELKQGYGHTQYTYLTERYINNGLTHMDAKVTLFHDAVTEIVKHNPLRVDHLWRIFAYAHLAYLCAGKPAMERVTTAIFATGSVADMTVHIRELSEEAGVKGNGKDGKPKKLTWPTSRHQPGYYFCSKENEDEVVSQKSLAGLPTCDAATGDEHSMVHALQRHRGRLARAKENGAFTGTGLLAELKSTDPVTKCKRYPGAGGLMTTRVLTYLEGTSLFAGAVKPYLGMTDGPGNKVPARLVAAQLGIADKEAKQHHGKVMASVQRRLNTRSGDGKLPLQTAVEAAAEKLPSLRPIARQCGEIASTLITGGTVETILYAPLAKPSPLP